MTFNLARTAFLPALLCALAPLAHADEVRDLVGIEPGAAAPFAMPTWAGIALQVQAPVPEGRLRTILHDTEYVVSVASGRVAMIQGDRAYVSRGQCEDAIEDVRGLLRPALPQPYDGPEPDWQMQNPDGSVTARLECIEDEGSPYPVMQMVIAHTGAMQELLGHFDEHDEMDEPPP